MQDPNRIFSYPWRVQSCGKTENFLVGTMGPQWGVLFFPRSSRTLGVIKLLKVALRRGYSFGHTTAMASISTGVRWSVCHARRQFLLARGSSRSVRFCARGGILTGGKQEKPPWWAGACIVSLADFFLRLGVQGVVVTNISCVRARSRYPFRANIPLWQWIEYVTGIGDL